MKKFEFSSLDSLIIRSSQVSCEAVGMVIAGVPVCSAGMFKNTGWAIAEVLSIKIKVANKVFIIKSSLFLLLEKVKIDRSVRAGVS